MKYPRKFIEQRIQQQLEYIESLKSMKLEDHRYRELHDSASEILQYWKGKLNDVRNSGCCVHLPDNMPHVGCDGKLEVTSVAIPIHMEKETEPMIFRGYNRVKSLVVLDGKANRRERRAMERKHNKRK
jgi:hypothetical protein